MTDSKAQPTAAMRAAEIIWRDTDTFDLPTEQGVPKLAAIIERETLCGEMAECLRSCAMAMSATMGRAAYLASDASVFCGANGRTFYENIAAAERLLARVENHRD